MSFVSILKSVGLVAKDLAPVLLPVVAGVINPALVPVFAFASQAVLNTEQAMAGASGPAKLNAAVNTLSASAPALIKSIEIATNSELADEELFASGMRKITDGAAEMWNSFRATS